MDYCGVWRWVAARERRAQRAKVGRLVCPRGQDAADVRLVDVARGDALAHLRDRCFVRLLVHRRGPAGRRRPGGCVVPPTADRLGAGEAQAGRFAFERDRDDPGAAVVEDGEVVGYVDEVGVQPVTGNSPVTSGPGHGRVASPAAASSTHIAASRTVRPSAVSLVASTSVMSTARTRGSWPARKAACIASAAASPPVRLAGRPGATDRSQTSRSRWT